MKYQGVSAVLLMLLFVASANVIAQEDTQGLASVDRAFASAAELRGAREAYLDFLSRDSVVFRPAPVNGIAYWTSEPEKGSSTLVRDLIHTDIAANGLFGYTTGNWRIYQKGKDESLARFGQYVTIWEKGSDGTFKATLDIGISHPKLNFLETDRTVRFDTSRDLNKRGWSPADASMKFLKMSMGRETLGGAYDEFAAKDVRLLRDGDPPILGKKNVVTEMKQYIAAAFPKRVVAFQSADMAYVWNPCEFTNSVEGMDKGNCLHIWKLRDKKWWIVLGIFARLPNDTEPELKIRAGSHANRRP